MYDRVNLTAWVPSAEAVLDRLPPATEVREPGADAVVHRGQVGPFLFFLRDRALRLRGSLRACAGSGTAPPAVASEARAWLAHAFGIDLGDAHVTRLEVSADLALINPACMYLPLLLALPRHKRLAVDSETLKFMTARRSYQFYDKAGECGIGVSGGLMRVELGYRRGGVSDAFGHGVTLARLAALDFRETVADAWATWYARVEKGREFVFDGSVRRLTLALQARGLEAEGVAPILERIGAARKAEVIAPQRASDLRRKVLALARDDRLTRPSLLIAELDAAVAWAAETMRA